jgi:hypothetical protein
MPAELSPTVRGAPAALPAVSSTPVTPVSSNPATPSRELLALGAPPKAENADIKPPADRTKPTAPTTTIDSATAKLRMLYRLAAEANAAMDSYIVRVRRREQVNGKDRPEELVILKFRKQPFSVYFKFLGPEGKGREVTYVLGQYGNMIHSIVAAGDVPLVPAGRRMSIAPDSIFLRTASRHTITEAGFGNIIDRFGRLLDANEKGNQRYGTVKYLGQVKRPEYEQPLDVAEQGILAGYDPNLPRGGRRWIMFEPTTRLPLLVITHDHTGHEVEFYCYDRLEWPVKLDDDDFNPDKLWPNRPPTNSRGVPLPQPTHVGSPGM